MSETTKLKEKFDLTGKEAVITGGAGLLGSKHAEALAEFGAITVLLDIDQGRSDAVATQISKTFGVESFGVRADITNLTQIEDLNKMLIEKYGRVDILINNAANNPAVGTKGLDGSHSSRLEAFSMQTWDDDIAVGLTGAFLCARVFGAQMAQSGGGIILNIASDLAVIAPDQRLYRKDDVDEQSQPVKPVTYSVVKSGLVGLTKYLATYWAEQGIRCNALSPGGVYVDQDDVFLSRISKLIPMGRMAQQDEYKGAIIFLVSDASSYMTGANIIVDGGRTVW